MLANQDRWAFHDYASYEITTPVLMSLGAAMREHVQAFTGEWVMDPEGSAYTSGPPPQSGRYTLALDGDSLKVGISGTTAAGEPINTGYVLDLSGDTSLSAGPVDRVRTIAEPGRLATIAYAGDTEVALAWRILADSGDKMTIVQSAPGQDRVWRNDVSVYRRAQRD